MYGTAVGGVIMKKYVVTVTLNPALDKTVVVSKFEVGGLNRVQSMRTDPGGKGINVARVLTGFGVAVNATGLIAGTQGQLVKRYLEEEKISESFVTIPGQTRTNLKVVDASTKVTTEINEAGFSVGQEEINNFKQQLTRLLEDASFLVLSGSLPPQVDSRIYGKLIEIARAKGVKTVLDADDSALDLGIAARPVAIKPNIYELEKLVGRSLTEDAAVITASREIIGRGVEIVIVSMGAQGSLVVGKDEAYRATVEPMIPKSTVGAGDSMVGVLVYSLLEGFPLSKIAQWVTAAGSVTASKPGTEVCKLPEVEQFLPKVHVSRQS
ncbi:MAG: 1-phosphofructokinase [Firmicutes bacterium]|nr:1-phosphofructokinase [Bacillota bacterium]